MQIKREFVGATLDQSREFDLDLDLLIIPPLLLPEKFTQLPINDQE